MPTACAFWMMKIITTVRPAAPAISAVRMPLIRVCAGRSVGRGGGGGAWGAEPLAEGGGRVLVGPWGAGGSVMALLASRTGSGSWTWVGSV